MPFLSSAFGGGINQVSPAQKSDREVQEAALRERMAARKRKGRGSTVITGGLGVTQPGPIARKTLLGG